MALIVAVSGIYGQVAYSVSQRGREIGVRMAMGASSGSVQKTVVMEGTRLAAVGILLGGGLALGFAKLLSSALFGLPWLDLPTFGAVGGTLGVSMLLASWIPARRASVVDPMEALRAE